MIRLGVIGTGRIASRFVADAMLVPEVQIDCIYNPHTGSAQAFAENYHREFHRVFATDDWEQLMARVDAVYIAAPHHTHVDYARRALLMGKHVLCEKPMAFSTAEAEELFALAARTRLVLMEAIKTAYCPGFRKLIEVARSGKIGEIRDVEACFTKLTDPAGRELSDPLYGGSFIELGTYVMLPVIELFGDTPEDIRFYSVKDEKGIDLFTKAHSSFAQGFGLAKAGVGVKSEGELIISGTQGYIYAKAPWWLTKEFEVRYEDPNEREQYTFAFEKSGLHYELQEFADEICRDDRNNDEKRQLSVALAAVMERFLAQRQ